MALLHWIGMDIEDMQLLVAAVIAAGITPLSWRIATPVLHDLIRRAAGGAALILTGDGVRIAGLFVEIADTQAPGGIELVCDAAVG